MSRFFDWLRYRNRPTLTGVYQGHGVITPHMVHVPLVVGAKVARRLQAADRVRFVATERADGVAQARYVRIYRRPQRRRAS
jgi:hypothetical protein